MADHDAAFAPGALVAGKYRIDRVIAEGGMGVLLAAHHEGLATDVAIKILHARVAEHDEARQRFRREVQAVARLRSDHVVRVFDVDETEDGALYMVMELLDGHDLETHIERHGTMNTAEAVRHVFEALKGVAAAHAAGIIHRDIKLRNLFLAEADDGSTRVKVLDFGIAKVSDNAKLFDEETGKITSSQSLLGTPAYMSPEQVLSSKDVDGRTDIWSMGVVLYELLTGEMLFGGETAGAVFAKVLNMPIPRKPLQDFRVPRDLQEVIIRCLKRDRLDRYETVAELLDALEPFLGGSALAMADTAAIPLPVGEAAPKSHSVTDLTWGRVQSSGPSRARLAGMMTVVAVVAVAGTVFYMGRRAEPQSTAMPAAASEAAPAETSSAGEHMPHFAPEPRAVMTATASATAAPTASASAAPAAPRWPAPKGPIARPPQPPEEPDPRPTAAPSTKPKPAPDLRLEDR